MTARIISASSLMRLIFSIPFSAKLPAFLAFQAKLRG
jgi:hypothetical protein